MRARIVDDRSAGVPLVTQVVSGIGGLLLVVGIALVGVSYAESGSWGSWSDARVRVLVTGLALLLGASILHAVRQASE